MLRSLANIFIVRPETIKSYLSESYLARIDPKLLKTFLMQRSDYSDLSRSFWNDVSLRRFFFACERLTTECRCAVRRPQTHSVYSGGRDALRRRRAREATSSLASNFCNHELDRGAVGARHHAAHILRRRLVDPLRCRPWTFAKWVPAPAGGGQQRKRLRQRPGKVGRSKSAVVTAAVPAAQIYSATEQHDRQGQPRAQDCRLPPGHAKHSTQRQVPQASPQGMDLESAVHAGGKC
jgi:hypothetical protein